MSPSDLVATYRGENEQAAVTPAQHPISIIGKSWTRDKKEPKLNDHDMPEPLVRHPNRSQNSSFLLFRQNVHQPTHSIPTTWF